MGVMLYEENHTHSCSVWSQMTTTIKSGNTNSKLKIWPLPNFSKWGSFFRTDKKSVRLLISSVLPSNYYQRTTQRCPLPQFTATSFKKYICTYVRIKYFILWRHQRAFTFKINWFTLAVLHHHIYYMKIKEL